MASLANSSKRKSKGRKTIMVVCDRELQTDSPLTGIGRLHLHLEKPPYRLTSKPRTLCTAKWRSSRLAGVAKTAPVREHESALRTVRTCLDSRETASSASS